jgi:regulator of sigma E protease
MSLEGIFLFIITLGILVFVHEMGHFLAAKSVGVTVEEFAFGFGPRLVTFLRRGGTDYTVRALPLGGFVSMIGMQPEDVSVPNGLMSKPAWARAWVFVAGPLMNVVLAFLVLCSMGMITGAPVALSRQVVQVQPKSEAQRVGLKTGDVVVAINGSAIKDGEELIKQIQSHPGQPITLTVTRDGKTLPPIKATPKPEEQKENNKPVLKDGKPVVVGKLGFQPGYVFKRLDFQKSVEHGVDQVQGFFLSLYSIVQRGQLKESMGGPGTILRVSEMNAALPPGYHYGLIGQLSMSLAVFNLLPLPVLDGGHLAILLVEVLRRRRLSPETHRAVTAVGLVVIGMLFVFLMYSDVSKWVAGKMLP